MTTNLELGQWARPPEWLRIVARIGYVAKALIYLLMGSLAVYEAIHHAKAESNPKLAMHFLQLQPTGDVLVGVLAAGFVCYGVHRCLEAWLGPVPRSHLLLRIIHRIGRFAGGATYLGFAWLAVDLVFLHRGSTGGGSGPVAAWALRHPLGNAAIMAIGGVIAIVGGKFIYDGVSGRYRRSFQLDKFARPAATAIRATATFGICSRGLAFLLAGALAIYGGIRSAPEEASGLRAVWQTIARLPFGHWLLGAFGAGFLAYGLFCLVRARYGSYPSDAGV